MKEPKAKKKKKPINPLLEKLGKKLTLERKKLGYESSEPFAYDKGLNRPQYGKYEAGAQDLRFTTLVKITSALGLTLEEFFRNGLD